MLLHIRDLLTVTRAVILPVIIVDPQILFSCLLIYRIHVTSWCLLPDLSKDESTALFKRANKLNKRTTHPASCVFIKLALCRLMTAPTVPKKARYRKLPRTLRGGITGWTMNPTRNKRSAWMLLTIQGSGTNQQHPACIWAIIYYRITDLDQVSDTIRPNEILNDRQHRY